MEDKSKEAAERVSEILLKSRRETVEEDYKMYGLTYQLVSESLVQGKNAFQIRDVFEFLEKRHKEAFEELKSLDASEEEEDEDKALEETVNNPFFARSTK